SALSWSGSHRVIVEEYMEGPEYSLDAVVEHGKVTLCGLADRHIYFPPYFIEMGHTMPAVLSEKDTQEILAVFEKGIRALGIRNGTAKGDLKLTSRGGMIGEIAARLSGGYMSGWTFPYSSGVNVTEAAMNIALGLPVGDLTPRFSRHSAERAFISIPGVVESLTGLSEARKQPGVRDVFVRVRPGDRVNFPRNNVEKCGNIISCAETRREAVDAAEGSLGYIGIRLLPGVEETGRYLYGTPEPGMPDAWSPGAAIETALKRLPFSDQGSGGSADGLPAVIPLPELDTLDSRDWHSLTPVEGLERIRRSGILPTDRDSLGRLGLPFWKAFFRGGPEGGLWALRTFAQDPRLFLENVRVWSES
ncbi:MAG: ATP-grasp domain-containing protein, partial [Spirochaetales bacterium]|nr:ATP-grasp domain-containing protein [Spirochaetales bacterium]